MRFNFRLLGLTGFSALATITLAQKEKLKPVTIEFAESQSFYMYSFKQFAWMRQHDLLSSDGPTGLTDWDVKSGKKTSLGDTTSLASLKAAGGPSSGPLPWPDIIDPNGNAFLYHLSAGYFLFDITSNSFKKLDAIPSAAEQVRLSPDDSMVSFVKDHNLYGLSIADGQTKQLTTTGAPSFLNGTLTWEYWEEIYNHDDTATWWSPDSKHLAFFETDESPVPLSTVVDFRQQYPKLVTQCYPKPGQPNPIVRLKVIDESSGDIASVPVVDGQEYIVGVKWAGPDELLFETLNRAQSEAKFNVFKPSTGTAATIAKDDNNWLDVYTDFDYIDGGKYLLFDSAKDGQEHLYKAATDGSGSVQPVTHGSWQVISKDLFGPDAVDYVDREHDRIFFTCTRDSYLDRNVYSVNTDGSNLQEITKEQGTHSASFSPDGRYYVDSFSSLKAMPRDELRSSDGKLIAVVAKSDPSVMAQYAHSTGKLTFIPARDGFLLPAWIVKPRNMKPGKKYPVILSIYGGPEAPQVNDQWDFGWADNQLYCDAGFIVANVDCRSSMVKDRLLTANVHGHFYGASERNDFVDAARWLKKQPDIDPNRVGIMGWSGGGGNTLNCMCHSTEFKAGIAGAPYADPSFYDVFYSEHLFGLPKDNPQGYADAAVEHFAKNLHGKLLLMWGTGDDNVHPQNEEAFIDACIAAGKQIQVMIYPMRKHGFADLGAIEHRQQAFLDFFKANL